MSLTSEIKELKNAIIDNGGVLVTGVVATAADLAITAASAKDIIMTLGANDTSKKLSIKDSDGVEVAKIDGNGLITSAAGLVGPVTGAVTGNVTGNLTGNVTGDVTGATAGVHTGGVIFPAPAAVDFNNGHADYTLNDTEQKSLLLIATNADAGAAIIAPAANKMYILRNASGQTVTLKKSAGTGISVANGKTAVLVYDGSDYVRVTADATH